VCIITSAVSKQLKCLKRHCLLRECENGPTARLHVITWPLPSTDIPLLRTVIVSERYISLIQHLWCEKETGRERVKSQSADHVILYTLPDLRGMLRPHRSPLNLILKTLLRLPTWAWERRKGGLYGFSVMWSPSWASSGREEQAMKYSLHGDKLVISY